MESTATATALPPACRLPVQRWWLRRSVRVKGNFVLAIPLAALLLISVASLLLQHSEQQQRTATRAAFALTTAAGELLTDSLNAETGVRGYVATSNSAFLGPYRLAQAGLGADRRNLAAAAVAEGDQPAVRRILATSALSMGQLDQLRALTAAGMPTARLGTGLLQGKASMDLLRSQIASLTRQPQAVLASGRTSVTSLETEIDRVTIGGLVLGLLAGLAGSALFTSGLARRIALSAANADRLGEGRPMVPVPQAQDELGQLNSSLARAEQLLATRNEELISARDEALQANHAKNAFLSNTSHELRTPLNSVLGFTQLLQLAELGEEDRDSVERILGAGRHLLALINELIDVARIESGELSLSLEPVPLAPLADEAAQLLRPLAAGRSVRITQKCAAPHLAVRADKQRLSQILVNLISNAVKYNRRGGDITISCQAESDSRVTIVIADTGPGLTPDELERIFVPFERLGAETGGTEGTGIGLPLARGLAEAMGGQLTAASVPGEGSAFSISLPRADDVILSAPEGPEAAVPAVVRQPGSPDLSVLYIEDNAANVEVVSRYLRGRGGTRLRNVASGREGIESAIRDVPDLVLLDLQLTDIRGEQVLRELRGEPATARVPVVILSAEASSGMIRRLTGAGAVAYLTKPLQLAELGELLDAVTPGSGR